MQDNKSTSKAAYQPLPSERASSVAPGGTGNNQFNNIDLQDYKNEGGLALNNIDEVHSSVSHGGTGGQRARKE